MNLNIGLISKNHKQDSPAINLPYTSLKLMERVAVDRFINNNRHTAVLRGLSDSARQAAAQAAAQTAARATSQGLPVNNRPFTPKATVSYYNPINNTIQHFVLRYEDSTSLGHASRDIWYTDNLPGFLQQITTIIADIPSSGGKRRKRNTYKKRNGRRRKTQYRRR